MTPRLASVTDAPACASILNNWIDRTPWMPRIHTPQAVHDYYAQVVLPQRRTWVVGHPVAGFLALDTDENLVSALYVATPRRGLGQSLLDIAKAGCSFLQLWTFQANKAAQAFYAKQGFRAVRTTAGDNEERLPDILLRWEASP